MQATNKEFKGIILLIVGWVAVTYAMYYTPKTYQMILKTSLDTWIFIIPAFVLSIIAFTFAFMFLNMKLKYLRITAIIVLILMFIGIIFLPRYITFINNLLNLV